MREGGRGEEFKVIENVNEEMINVEKNIRRKIKARVLAPAVETDNGKMAH